MSPHLLRLGHRTPDLGHRQRDVADVAGRGRGQVLRDLVVRVELARDVVDEGAVEVAAAEARVPRLREHMRLAHRLVLAARRERVRVVPEERDLRRLGAHVVDRERVRRVLEHAVDAVVDARGGVLLDEGQHLSEEGEAWSWWFWRTTQQNARHEASHVFCRALIPAKRRPSCPHLQPRELSGVYQCQALVLRRVAGDRQHDVEDGSAGEVTGELARCGRS